MPKEDIHLSGIRDLRQKFIGNRAFYRIVFAIIVPMIIQNSVSNFVNLLDNIMVGQLGTAQMSGVAITNQLIFVVNLCLFGGLSGPGIYGAQFFGAGDMEGLRNTFRIKLWMAAAILLVASGAFIGWGDRLIAVFLTGEGDPADAASMLVHAKSYLNIILLGLPAFAMTQCYAGTLRETGETVIPMKAGIAAVLTNLCGNWLLIFGNLGFPALGVEGAAIATVISRFVELGIIVLASHRVSRFECMRGVYRTLRVPSRLLKSVLKKGMPLLINEGFWSLGMATLTQTYSLRGLAVLAGLNIASTISNLFNVVFLSMGNAVAVMAGQALGANDMERARSDVWKLMFFGVATCVIIGGIMAVFSPFFPGIYKTETYVHALASRFILTSACLMPFIVIAHCSYFTLRSGGSTFITFLFDSVFTWAFHIPYALFLVNLTNLDIMILYPLCAGAEILKSMIGLILVKKGVWIRNIVSARKEAVPAP